MSKAASFQEHVNSCLLVVVGEGEVFIIIIFFLLELETKRDQSLGKARLDKGGFSLAS